MANKLTTEEILARARAQAAGDSDAGGIQEPASSAEEPASPSPAEASADDQAAGAAAAAKPTPGSTADILAAARAQAAGKKSSEAPAAGEAAAKPAAAKPAAGGAPKSTADILARARAQASGGGGAAPAGQPAAKPKAKAAAAGVAASGDTPSVQEMLQAVRSGKPAAESAPAAAAVAPPVPVRPPAKKGGAKAVEDRRSVLAAMFAPFTLAWTGIVGATTAALLGLARYMMPNVLVEPPTKFKIGPPSDYPPGTVSTKWKAARGIWVVNTDQYNGESLIYALSSVCTHLGCTPNWLEGEQKFKCPCHGSGFYITGINFEGPAPRPLERVGIRLSEDGMLEVDKSVKFQEELGQWEDGTSFFSVV
jgi:cytochrome b6-f complex iron-sulfur subunit